MDLDLFLTHLKLQNKRFQNPWQKPGQLSTKVEYVAIIKTLTYISKTYR